MKEMPTIWFMVPALHPTLAGHFPGQPIVPGVVLLDAVHAAVQSHTRRALVAIPNAKFLRAVLPDEQLELRVQFVDDTSARFQALCAGVAALEGTLLLSRLGT